MRQLRSLLALGFVIGFIGACDNRMSASKHTVVDTSSIQLYHDTIPGIRDSTVGVLTLTQGPNYSFQPDISVLTGKLKIELYYGAPNFGEDSTENPTDRCYIFYPDDTINVIQRKEVRPGEESHDFTVTGIYKFQLAPMPSGPDLHPFIDKKLKITGCFYGAFNHHQVTDVVLATYTAEEVKK